MKIYCEGIENYKPWSGAVDFYEEIVDAGNLNQLEFILEDIYPEGMSEIELNDLLWFEEDAVREWLGMNEEEEEDE